jgi:AraC-like DNA-binding protein
MRVCLLIAAIVSASSSWCRTMSNISLLNDWVRHSPTLQKMERIEAFFSGHGFTPHRHDTYAIGTTLSGVQSFQYRRSQRHSLPGNILVLHPDEVHDGQAGTEAGFRYRMVYIEPALIQQVLGGKPLPFIEGGLSSDPRLYRATRALLCNLDSAMDPLEEDDMIYDLAQALEQVSGRRVVRKTLDFVAAERARALIHSALDRVVTLDELSQASGRDRWSLSRDFRALYGTSPYRYMTHRRLDLVRVKLTSGCSLAESAVSAGFFDQSHMTRQFIQAYGVAPGKWLRRLQAS